MFSVYVSVFSTWLERDKSPSTVHVRTEAKSRNHLSGPRGQRA